MTSGKPTETARRFDHRLASMQGHHPPNCIYAQLQLMDLAIAESRGPTTCVVAFLVRTSSVVEATRHGLTASRYRKLPIIKGQTPLLGKKDDVLHRQQSFSDRKRASVANTPGDHHRNRDWSVTSYI